MTVGELRAKLKLYDENRIVYLYNDRGEQVQGVQIYEEETLLDRECFTEEEIKKNGLVDLYYLNILGCY